MSSIQPTWRSRLFILGLDGTPLWLLRKFFASGDLPNIARIFESGSAVEMDSSLPDVSAVAWTSVNTGKNPGKHGIYGFVDRKPGSNSLEVMTASHVRAKTIWELVSEGGGRAIAINVPLSFPPQPINGIVVSDFLAPALAKAVHPAALLPRLESIGYRIDTDPWAARQSLDAFIEDFAITARKRAETVLELMNGYPWDLFMVVFMETDRLHHFMWQYMEEEEQTYGAKFRDAYRLLDDLVGKIVDELGDEDELIIMSDHGFTSLKREVYLNFWLEENGYLSFQANGEKGLEHIETTSRAFSLDPGRIYVNLDGREVDGSIKQDQVPELLSELAAGLEGLRDPEGGEQIINQVYRADEIYEGPERARAPDLLAMPNDGYDIKGTFESNSLTGRGKLVGMHKYDNATLFIRGHDINVAHASVRDVLPTACGLLGFDCPSDVDGRSVVNS